MKAAYRVLAYLVALGVVVQAGMIVFAVAGLEAWIADGGVADKAALENEDLSFTGVTGFMIHGMNGMMIIPLLSLALLVVSFFAKVPNGVRNAAAILGLVVLQVALGIFGHEYPYVGMLHGLNALVLFATALLTARGVRTGDEVGQHTARTPAAV